MALFLKKYLDGKYNDDDPDMIRDKILLQRRVNPNKVNLPDEQTLYTRYQRVCRKNLPANVAIKKARAIEPRRGRK